MSDSAGQTAAEQPAIEQPTIEQPTTEQPGIEQTDIDKTAIEETAILVGNAFVANFEEEKAKPLALGDVNTISPLQDPVKSDNLFKSVKAALAGGKATTDYFEMVNNVGRAYANVARTGESVWKYEADPDLPGTKFAYSSIYSENHKEFYLKISARGISFNEAGEVVQSAKETRVAGFDYKIIGGITLEAGCKNSKLVFHRTTWELGTSVDKLTKGDLLKTLSPLLSEVAATTANQVKEAAKKLKEKKAEDDAAYEAEVKGAQNIASKIQEIAVKVLTGILGSTAAASGTAFIGAAVLLATLFSNVVPAPGYKYHVLRVWNLTRYTLWWKVHFDTSALVDEGDFVRAHAIFDEKGNVISWLPIPAIDDDEDSKTSGAKRSNYGDFTFIGSVRKMGIGYVMKLDLTDDSGSGGTGGNSDDAKYTCAAVFDVPAIGDNSLAATFNGIDDGSDKSLQKLYKTWEGARKDVWHSATSRDKAITLSVSYDALSGSHPFPYGQGQGKKDKEESIYQSVVVVEETALSEAREKSGRAFGSLNPVNLQM